MKRASEKRVVKKCCRKWWRRVWRKKCCGERSVGEECRVGGCRGLQWWWS